MKRMKKLKMVTAIALSAAMLISAVPSQKVEAQIKPWLSCSFKIIKVGEKLTLKLNGAKKGIKWSTSKKSVATVSKKGVVVGKKAGDTTITAKYQKKKYRCYITVKKKSVPTPQSTETPATTQAPQPAETPATTQTPHPGKTPMPAPNPVTTKLPVLTQAPQSTKTPEVTQVPVETTESEDIVTEEGTFRVGKKTVALQMSYSEMKQKLGEPSREAQSPYGGTVCVYPSTTKQLGYLLVFVKSDVVIGFEGIGSSCQYGSLVKTGTKQVDLLSAGWTSEGWYAATDKKDFAVGSVAVTYKTNNALVTAFSDYFGTGEVYGIQVLAGGFASQALHPQKNTYSKEIITEQQKELGELIKEYQIFVGKTAYKVNTYANEEAQKSAEKIAAANNIDGVTAQEVQNVLVEQGIEVGESRLDRISGYVDALDILGGFAGDEKYRCDLLGGNGEKPYRYFGVGVANTSANDTYAVLEVYNDLYD